MKRRGNKRGGRKKTQRKRPTQLCSQQTHSRLKITALTFLGMGITSIIVWNDIEHGLLNAHIALKQLSYRTLTTFSSLNYLSQLGLVSLIGTMAVVTKKKTEHPASKIIQTKKGKKTTKENNKKAIGSGWENFIIQHSKTKKNRKTTQKVTIVRTKQAVKETTKKNLGFFTKLKSKIHMKESDKRKLTRKKGAKTFRIKTNEFETGIDALHRAVHEHKQISIDDVVVTFKISKELAEEWAKTLNAKGLISISYPTFGSMMLTIPHKKDGKDKTKKTKETKAKK